MKISNLYSHSGVLQVLDVEFYNVKALYRRAQAYIGTADFVLAELEIKKALEADPQNRYVKELIVSPLDMQFIMKIYSLCGVSYCSFQRGEVDSEELETTSS